MYKNISILFLKNKRISLALRYLALSLTAILIDEPGNRTLSLRMSSGRRFGRSLFGTTMFCVRKTAMTAGRLRTKDYTLEPRHSRLHRLRDAELYMKFYMTYKE